MRIVAGDPELSSIWLRGKKYSKNLHKRQSDAAKILRPIFI